MKHKTLRQLVHSKQAVSRRYFIFGASFSLLLLVLCVGGLSASALESAGWVDSHVAWTSPAAGTAKPTVVGWENSCTNLFNSNSASMPHGTAAQQRTVVNASAYWQNIWLTRAGDASNINNNPVAAGAAVNMQVNDILFLCGILTMNASGFGIDPTHQVTNGNYPNDRAPVPDSNAAQYKVNQASRYESNAQITNVRVVSGPGSVSNNPVGQILHYVRDNNSRYWAAAPVPFTYNVPAGLAAGTYTVTIDVTEINIQTYHAYGAAGTSRCTLRSTGSSATIPYDDFSVCTANTQPYLFTFTVSPPPVPYTLTPTISDTINGTTPANNVAQVGDTVVFTYAVNNATSTNSSTVSCTTYGQTFPGYHTAIPAGEMLSGAGPGTNCPRIVNAHSNPTVVVPSETVLVTTDNTTICRSLYVNPYSSSTPGSAGTEDCVLVAAKPYAKVFGGDTSAGTAFSSSTGACTNDTNAQVLSWNKGSAGYPGSGAQYAAYALNSITSFATNQNGTGSGAPSSLAFANATASGSSLFGGLLGSWPCMPDYYDAMPSSGTSSLSGSVNISPLTTNVYTSSSSLQFPTGGNVNPNDRIQIYVNGDVYIGGNITYVGSWSVKTMPLLEIIAKGNIYIGSGVTQLDGLYIAQPNGATGGTIYTCATGLGAPADTSNATYYTTCNNKLTVNGSLVANTMQLLRTTGTVSNSSTADTATSNNAAESINGSPAFWIPSTATTSTSSDTLTPGSYDYIQSLPPIL